MNKKNANTPIEIGSPGWPHGQAENEERLAKIHNASIQEFYD
jgi:hypothetical protein